MSLRAFAFASALALAVMFSGTCNATHILSKRSSEEIVCLAVSGTPANNVEVIVDLCENGNHLDWDIRDDGSIQMDNFCLDISGSTFANNTQLELYECLGNDAQTWKIDGNMISTKDGKFCIDEQWSIVPGNAVIWGCDKDDKSQQWIV